MVRVKHRFLFVEIVGAPNYRPAGDDVVAGFREPVTRMFGLLGAGHCLGVMRFVTWDREKRVGVLRVPRDWGVNVRTMLETTDMMSNMGGRFVVHHVAGTIDQAQRWIEVNGDRIGSGAVE